MHRPIIRWNPAALTALLGSIGALAHEPQVMDQVVVTGRYDSLVSLADTASEGYVGRDHLDFRPLQRPGELLETIPGMIATQHSGDGKANQYFSRGFNLDHGTDFATSVDGVPINLPTHAHGQGYTDLNFVIPELIDTIHYRKGVYYADVGDFGSAGSAEMRYVDALPQGLAELSAGSFGYYRTMAAASSKIGDGNLLYAGELMHDDGPWARPENFQKANGLLRYSKDKDGVGYSFDLSAYGAQWNSSDQLAQRAIPGLPGGQFGEIDPTDGGTTHRVALNGEWHSQNADGHTKVEVYGVYYDLKLYSNFTYFLNDPVHGDQFEQHDRRGFGGVQAHHTWLYELWGMPSESTVGLQVRGDDITNGINQTERRNYLSTTRLDDVGQVSLAPYVEQKTKWSDWLRTTAGARFDYDHFDVADVLPQNSGSRDSSLFSPKGTAAFGPWADTEAYVSAGMGFHSNDGRGAVTTVQPTAPSVPLPPVTPLVRTYGAEVGLRSTWLPHLQSTVSLWWLDIDSELVFNGDAGDTSPSAPSRRVGLEFANYYTPTPWVTLDADFSWSRARFRDTVVDDGYAGSPIVGRYIPEAIETVLATGVSVHDPNPNHGLFASLRLRYFGPRPLVEDNSVRSAATILLNAQAGYRFNRNWSLTVEAFNLLDRHDADITYYYPSRLPGEPAGGVNDLHIHPVEPISGRVTLTARF
jgi:outer membrane receptor protein involved in Fe transport